MGDGGGRERKANRKGTCGLQRGSWGSVRTGSYSGSRRRRGAHWGSRPPGARRSERCEACAAQSKVITSSSKVRTTRSGLGPRGSSGAPVRLIQQTLNPSLLAPTTRSELDETKRISPFISFILL